MSLNMYIGEVQAQTDSMNAFCIATIQGMEKAISSIDAFAGDVMLQGKTYDSAKVFFVQTYRQLAQGIIYLCEELIRQNDKFPSDFQSEVATVDVIEHEILEQIREINRTIASMEAISENMPGMAAMLQIYHAMKRKLEEKLQHLYEFNETSSDNYRTALELATNIMKGLVEVQGKGFQATSGTFSTQGLNMEWAKPIQIITEEKMRQAQIKKEMALKEQEANRPWYQKTAIGAWEFLQGAGNAALENVSGLEPPDNDELESKITYQAGRLGGNIITGIASIVEISSGLTIIGGSNLLTIVAEAGTLGTATPIVIPLDVAVTTAGATVAGHGGFVWYNTIQNSKDTIQKIQSSSGGKGTGKGSTVSEVKTFVDKGEQFTNGRKNRLKPDIRYKTGEYDYFYETDNLGRIEKFETDKLQLTEREKRLSHSKNTPGKVKGQDHAGHLAGDRFGGSPKIDNLVSQLSDVNLKKYKKVEDKWAAALKETPPKKVTVKVDIIYSGNDVRPDKFIVNYTIDGKPGSAKFKNL